MPGLEVFWGVTDWNCRTVLFRDGACLLRFGLILCVCVYDDPSVFLKGVSAGVTCTVPEDIFASSERQWCFVQLYLGITLSLIEV